MMKIMLRVGCVLIFCFDLLCELIILHIAFIRFFVSFTNLCYRSYDMLNGNMHIVTARTIKNLVEKGKELHYKLEGDDSIGDVQEIDGDEHVLKMIETLNELDLIKIQLSRWENTDLR